MDEAGCRHDVGADIDDVAQQVRGTMVSIFVDDLRLGGDLLQELSRLVDASLVQLLEENSKKSTY